MNSNTKASSKRKRTGGAHSSTAANSAPASALHCANLFPAPFDSNVTIGQLPTLADAVASTPTGSKAKAYLPATTTATPTNKVAKTAGHGKPEGSETNEEKQERIRRR